MQKESHVWKDLAEQSVPLHLARQVLQPVSFSEFSAYDAIPNSLESIHQYAANMVLQTWMKQESARATVMMPEHTGLPQVGIEVLKTMLRLGMTVQLVVVVTDHPQDALATWSAAAIDGLTTFDLSRRLSILGRNWKGDSGSVPEDGSELANKREELIDFLKGESRRKVVILFGQYYDLFKSVLEETHDLGVDLMIDDNFLSTAFTRLSKEPLHGMFDDDYLPVRHRLCLSSVAIYCQLEARTVPKYGGLHSGIAKSLNCGPVAFHLPRSAAVQRGLLRPVKIWPRPVRNFRARSPKDQAEAIISFLQRHPARSLYAFLPKNEAAQELHAELGLCQARNKVKSVYICADMNTLERYGFSELFAAKESVAVCSVYIVLENRSAPAVEAAFAAPGKISSLHTGRMIGLVSKLSDQTSHDYGSILVLCDRTKASEISLVLVLVALVAEDPLMIQSLRQVVLLSVALNKDLPSQEWPPEIRDLVGSGCTIPRHVLARAVEIVSASHWVNVQTFAGFADGCISSMPTLCHVPVVPHKAVAEVSE